MGVLAGLEPEQVFIFFEEISAIPRGSKNTGMISDYLVSFAQQRGLEFERDEKDNVVIRKDGSSGREAEPPIILQGHSDMVCEKEEGCEIEFAAEGIRLQVQDGIISAKGTTLGGDDGIAVAYMLAILDDPDLSHPPIEAVFTADEEIGMIGAEALDMGRLKGRRMLNIDSEEEGVFYVSCSGGVTVKAQRMLSRELFSGTGAILRISGLLGGHSGGEIHKGRASANKLLGRLLYELSKKTETRITSFSGGTVGNAIPKSASASLVVQDFSAASQVIQDISRKIISEFAKTDPDISITLLESGEAEEAQPFDQASTRDVIAALFLSPDGVQRMSFDVPGLVESSLNLGIARAGMQEEENKIFLLYEVRSSVESAKDEMVSRLSCLLEGMGFTVACSKDYPGWVYREVSPLREKMIEVYRELSGKEPCVLGIHAGLECGIFATRLPELDIMSFGPNLRDVHTPAESMEAESVKRTYEFLVKLLEVI